MRNSLYDKGGQRKYLIANERQAFVSLAATQDDCLSTFCLVLAMTGARISEVLSLTPERVDHENQAIVFETLKQRQSGIYRAIPVPEQLLKRISKLHSQPGLRLWPWCRTTGWKKVKRLMRDAGIAANLCKPKALRHAFGVGSGQNGVPLNITQRWLGHARIETTAIYADAIGEEERRLAHRSWRNLDTLL